MEFLLSEMLQRQIMDLYFTKWWWYSLRSMSILSSWLGSVNGTRMLYIHVDLLWVFLLVFWSSNPWGQPHKNPYYFHKVIITVASSPVHLITILGTAPKSDYHLSTIDGLPPKTDWHFHNICPAHLHTNRLSIIEYHFIQLFSQKLRGW